MTMNDEGALVLFSSSQDSTTCLAWALKSFARVETVGFDYGQRHRVELDCREGLRNGLRSLRPAWSDQLGQDHTIDLASLGALSDTALTRDVAIDMESNGLPNTFVPGRNIIFLNFAAALAYRRGLRHVVGGMCETDYSGYPDCRDDTIKAIQVALNLGMERRFVLHLAHVDRQDRHLAVGRSSLATALSISSLRETHTCYLGDRGQRHAWGYGCGQCPACDLRARGYSRFRPVTEQSNREGPPQMREVEAIRRREGFRVLGRIRRLHPTR